MPLQSNRLGDVLGILVLQQSDVFLLLSDLLLMAPHLHLELIDYVVSLLEVGLQPPQLCLGG